MSPTSAVLDFERVQVPDYFSFAKPNLAQNRCSKDYYTLTNSASFESLLFHPVPSPSLCLEEMLELWPSSPQPLSSTQQRQSGKRVYSRHTKEQDSISTLVDFGNWISQHPHSRVPSLLPPTPAALRQDLSNLKSDSVECSLSSAAQGLSHHVNQQENTIVHPTTYGDSLVGLCTDLQHSSITSDTTRRQTARTITPVPSLTYSQYSTTSSLAVEGPFPEARSSTYSNFPEISPATRDANMNHPAPDHFQHETKHIRPDQRLSFYQNESSMQRPDNAKRSTTQAPATVPLNHTVPVPNFDVTRLQPKVPQLHIPSGKNEVSYIDWDDDDEECGQRSESRLARMKKSLTDLRAAERFIADAASRRNTSHKPVKSSNPEESTAVISAQIPRPVYSRVQTDNSLLSLYHRQKQQRDRQRYSRSVSATDNIAPRSSNKPEQQKPAASHSISLSLPSKLGSIRALQPTRPRKPFNPKSKSISAAHTEQQLRQEQLTHAVSAPASSQHHTPTAPLPPPPLSSSTPDTQPDTTRHKRHQRSRTISSGLEGFPQLPTTTISGSADESCEGPHCPAAPIMSTSTTTLANTSALPTKRKRFSTFTSLSTPRVNEMVVPTENGKDKDKEKPIAHKRPRLGNGVVTKWVRRVFGGRNGKGKGKGKLSGTVSHRT
ncbi:hypothetical protein LTR84_007480 [Exophiala bonariae]|uniref:Uncharacterized protein n=1 Tax=Exophiala bonariae TaxID=1690606 RepID=A0AAV9N1E8_9EURO|nr:hypothetical protein LTR84_007480 [Exophiala bonariae]